MDKPQIYISDSDNTESFPVEDVVSAVVQYQHICLVEKEIEDPVFTVLPRSGDKEELLKDLRELVNKAEHIVDADGMHYDVVYLAKLQSIIQKHGGGKKNGG